MQQYRQGDVFLVRVEGVPPGDPRAIARVRGRLVLAEGEVTGHAHAIAEEEVSLLEFADGGRVLVAEVEAYLRHEEHDTITLAPGAYEVRRQREYSPEEIRVVGD